MLQMEMERDTSSKSANLFENLTYLLVSTVSLDFASTLYIIVRKYNRTSIA